MKLTDTDYLKMVLWQNERGLNFSQIASRLGVDESELFVHLNKGIAVANIIGGEKRIVISAKKDELLWFGGVFDGSGNIRIDAYNNNFSMRIELTCNETMADIVQRLMYGRVTTTQYGKSKKWYAMSRTAEIILSVVKPFLLVKRHQAEIAIQFQQLLSPGIPISPADLKRRYEFKAKLDAYKK